MGSCQREWSPKPWCQRVGKSLQGEPGRLLRALHVPTSGSHRGNFIFAENHVRTHCGWPKAALAEVWPTLPEESRKEGRGQWLKNPIVQRNAGWLMTTKVQVGVWVSFRFSESAQMPGLYPC